MAQKLALDHAGDEATFTVTSCKKVQTKFGDRMVFSGTLDDGLEVETPLMPDATALKQLSRLGLDEQTVVGETLRFSRAANPAGKPYWNIDAAGPKQAPSKRIAPTTKAEVRTEIKTEVIGGLDARLSIANAYLALYKHVRTALPQEAAEAVQAATATIWITWDKRGIQPDGRDAKPAQPTAPPIPTTPAPSGKRLTPDYANFPSPSDADATDDLPF